MLIGRQVQFKAETAETEVSRELSRASEIWVASSSSSSATPRRHRHHCSHSVSSVDREPASSTQQHGTSQQKTWIQSGEVHHDSSSHLYTSDMQWHYLSFINWIVDCDDPPKHILVPTVIKSPPSHEFMVSRIFSVVLIFLDPLLDKFTVMEVF